MLSESSVGAVTVTCVVFAMLDDCAVMVALPSPTPLARPLAAILATLGAFDDHNTEEVKFCVLPSLYDPIAWNCWVVPKAIETFVGAITIDTRVGWPTVSWVEEETCPSVADTVVAPSPALVAKPAVPGVLLIIATAAKDEFHDTVPVKSWLLPSL
jgi:hypothetical protein